MSGYRKLARKPFNRPVIQRDKPGNAAHDVSPMYVQTSVIVLPACWLLAGSGNPPRQFTTIVIRFWKPLLSVIQMPPDQLHGT
jgi:hypothetical protein